MSSGKLITAVLAAAGGAAIGILLAPDKGSETRKKISDKFDELADELEEKFDAMKEDFNEKMENIKSKAKDEMDEAAEATGSGDYNADRYSASKEGEEFSPGTTL